MINVLADRHLYNIGAYLPETINLKLYDPSEGLPDLDSAHALLVRTVNPINKQTLPNIPTHLSFLGTASAGTDHVDVDYLHRNNITFADAAGCNARSVAEYVAVALLLWADNRNEDLSRLSMGVAGVGNVGTKVINMANNIGISTLAYDPPREEREPAFHSVSMSELLDCDILTFHTPLTTEGNHPTYHWLDKRKLDKKNFALILNSARGGVINEEAVLRAKAEGSVGDLILDVWENEPNFNLESATNTFLKTPHIAGYSVQAKSNASKFVADALIAHFDLTLPERQETAKPKVLEDHPASFDSLSSLLTELHPIRTYEHKLENIIRQHPNERGKYFNKLRAEFPLRQEFRHIYLPSSYSERFPILKKLGFPLRGTNTK